MKIDNEFKIGDYVYLTTDIYQYERVVTGIILKGAAIQYELSCGLQCSVHYEFEICGNINIIKKMDND